MAILLPEEIDLLEKDKRKQLLFYDIEVFQYDSLVVFKDLDGNTVQIYRSDFPDILELISGKTLVGFNNHRYDDLILYLMLTGECQMSIKDLSDIIIDGRDSGYWYQKAENFSDATGSGLWTACRS